VWNRCQSWSRLNRKNIRRERDTKRTGKTVKIDKRSQSNF
jgi:hypothetical protein